MAETTADVRRDIELTRERMSSTLAELEQKMNVTQIVKDHPWPALALAIGAGVLLSGSSADVKAAAATVAATKGASSKMGAALDDMVASLLGGVHQALEDRVTGWVGELKGAIGAPQTTSIRVASQRARTRQKALTAETRETQRSAEKQVIVFLCASPRLCASAVIAFSLLAQRSELVEARRRPTADALLEILNALFLRAVTLPSDAS